MADKKIRLLVQAEVKKAVDELKRTENQTDKTTSAVKKLGAAFGVLASARVLGQFISTSVKTSAQFEALETRLVALKGSVDEGRKSFDFFNKVAKTTPFQLANVVEAGAQLEAFGADSTETLKAVSDLAAFMGTDIVEAANAFGRAFAGGAGAADVLRDRGVLMQVKLKTGFDDLSKLTLPQFQQALLDTLTDPEGNISGATDLLSQTFSGLVSNFQDSVSQLQDSIGDLLTPTIKGLIKFVKSGVDGLTDSFKQLNETAIETTIRKLKELGLEDEEFLRNIRDLERDVLLERRKAVQEQLDSSTSIQEKGNLITEELKAQGKLQLELLTINEQIETLKDKGRLSNKGRLDELTNESFELLKQIELSDNRIESLNTQIRLQKELSDLNKEIIPERPDFQLLPEDEDILGDLGLEQIEENFLEFENFYNELNDRINQRKIDDEKIRRKAENDAHKQRIQENLESAILQGQSAKQAAISVIKAEIAEAQAGLISSIMKSVPFPFNLALAAGAGAMVGKVTDQLFSSFATGGSFITKGRTTLPIGNGVMVGDNASGMERIDVTPLPAPPGNDRNITINISAPLVDETVVDHIIPAIRRAEKLGL